MIQRFVALTPAKNASCARCIFASSVVEPIPVLSFVYTQITVSVHKNGDLCTHNLGILGFRRRPISATCNTCHVLFLKSLIAINEIRVRKHSIVPEISTLLSVPNTFGSQ